MDAGLKKKIFEYDPNDPKDMVQTQVTTHCNSVKDATVISTVEKYRQQVNSEADVSGSVSGSGFSVSPATSLYTGDIIRTGKFKEMAPSFISIQNGLIQFSLQNCSGKNRA